MRKGGSKQKGSAAEREVTRMLSLWWSDGRDDSIFYLTAGSGARQTNRRKCGIDTHNSAGDVGYLDVSGKPLIDAVLFEIKRGYNNTLDILSIADAKPTRKPNIILQWLDKAEQERAENKRQYVLLILRRDYKEYVIIMSHAFEDKLAQEIGSFYMGLRTVSIMNEYTIMPLEAFFEWANSSCVKRIL
jgi:hypothetical protein